MLWLWGLCLVPLQDRPLPTDLASSVVADLLNLPKARLQHT